MNNNNRLPILNYKNAIRNKLEHHQVVIIVGETGCGKSTQLPKFLHEFGYTESKKVVCLHPRSIAACSLAERVSQEMRHELGSLVGYHIRFERALTAYTRIVFMTTGLLVRQIGMRGRDILGEEYSVVVIDEAHERSLQTDVMLGIMKMLLHTRGRTSQSRESPGTPKLVIMSATINIAQFTNYFPNAGLVEVTERMGTTDVIYRPLTSQDYLNQIRVLVEELFSPTSPSKGDILIFLQSEMKVRKCCDILGRANLPRSKIIKLFSFMDSGSKMKAFRTYPSKRKIIVSTNVAETSLTIPGIDIVIDSGAVKRIHYDHRTAVERWMTTYVSVAEADQRRGRTGRINRGRCYRLYEERFVQPPNTPNENRIRFPYISSSTPAPEIDTENQSFLPYPESEIRTGNLGSMILTLKLMNIGNILHFPFIERPDNDRLKEAIKQLTDLSLLDENSGRLSRLGRHVAPLPLDPSLGKVAIVGSKVGVRKYVNIMVGMLNGKNVMKNTRSAINHHRSEFNNEHGDLFRLIDIYQTGKENSFSKEWCTTNHLNHSCLLYVVKIVNQLNNVVPNFNRQLNHDRYLSNCLIKSAFLSAFFQNIAIPNDQYFRTANEPNVVIHQSSVLAQFRNKIMFHTVCSSADGQTFLRCCTVLEDGDMRLKPSVFDIKRDLWRTAYEFYFS